MFLLLIGLATALFLLARNGKLGPPPWARSGGCRRPHAQAEATLADRLANGDITADEYRERLAVLRESEPTPPPYNPGNLR
ncbi:SHOCT domain-containing protein [Propionibacteriaceae bacterium Y1700]|uniref:SHOCT domain-containing protein n=1 Tax=Microlunatus sp. Y1700 TaxID=3418487 RepID=UPI003DA7979B